MKMKDIKKQSDKELAKLLSEARAAVRQFRFNVTGSKVKNIKEGANAKRLVARILTELNLRKKDKSTA
jgi:ribosomal protein L29